MQHREKDPKSTASPRVKGSFFKLIFLPSKVLHREGMTGRGLSRARQQGTPEMVKKEGGGKVDASRLQGEMTQKAKNR